MTTRKTYDGVYFKALDEATGEFEAVVSVFGNVDLQGDRTMPGAFTKSLEKWRKTGDPIPVIWSHDWADPFAHIGYVNPTDAHEVVADQAKAYADGILGGLYVKGHLDVDKPFAKQVYDLLKEKRVKEWSFAYDVIDEKIDTKTGANNLNVVDLWEVGPTLKGANPSTFTMGVKSVLEKAAAEERSLKKITRALHIDSEVGLKMLKDIVRDDLKNVEPAKVLEDLEAMDPELQIKAMVEKADFKWDASAAMSTCHSAGDFRSIAFEKKNDSAPDAAAHWALPHHSRAHGPADEGGVSAALGRLDQTGPTVMSKDAIRTHLENHQSKKEHDGEGNWLDDVVLEAKENTELETSKVADAEGEKMMGPDPELEGSWEDTIADVEVAVNSWVDDNFPADAEGDRAFAYVIGTFPDHVVFCVCGYDVPNQYFSAAYTVDEASEDNEIALGAVTEVQVETTVTAKSKAALKPWRVEKRGEQYCVVKETDGSTEACHDTRSEALAHMRALYANEPKQTSSAPVKVDLPQSTTTSTSTVTWTNLAASDNVTTFMTDGEKAGRVFSQANEEKIRRAHDALGELLSIIDSLHNAAVGGGTQQASDGSEISKSEEPDKSKAELDEYRRRIELLGL